MCRKPLEDLARLAASIIVAACVVACGSRPRDGIHPPTDAVTFVATSAGSDTVTTSSVTVMRDPSVESSSEITSTPNDGLSDPPSTATLEGTILLPDGSPAIGARVNTLPKNTNAAACSTTSTVDGSFALHGVPPGLHALRAEVPGLVPVTRSAVAPTTGIVLQFKRRTATLTGSVVTRGDGVPVTGARVVLDPRLRSDTDAWLSVAPPLPTATANADGSFTLTDIPPGRYACYARTDQLGPLPGAAGSAEVVLAAGETTSGIILQVYPGHTIEGTVRDAIHGSPLGTVNVSCGKAEDTTPTVTNAEGYYRLGPVFQLPATRLAIAAAKEGYLMELPVLPMDARKEVVVTLPSDRDMVRVDLAMRERPVVEGVVVDASGHRQANAQLTWYSAAPDGSVNTHNSRTDNDGQFKLVPNPFDRLQISVRTTDNLTTSTPQFRVANESIRNLRLVVGAGFSIEGEVLNPDGTPAHGAFVCCTFHPVQCGAAGSSAPAFEANGGTTFTDAGGRFRLENLPGQMVFVHAVDIRLNASDAMRVLRPVDKPAHVILHLRHGRDVHGVVVNDAGCPEAGVAVAGDSPALSALSRRSEAVSRQDGRFALRVTHSARRLTATAPDGRTANKSLGDDDSPVTLVLTTSDDTRTFIGTVMESASGALIRQFEVIIDQPGEVVHDDAGVFRIEDVPVGTRVTVTAADRLPVTETCLPGKASEPDAHTFLLGRPGGLRGRVVAGNPRQPVAKTFVLSATAGSDSVAQALTGADGIFELPRLHAGEAELFIEPPAPWHEMRRNVEIRENRVTDLGDIAVGGGGIVTVRVIRAASGSPAADVAMMLVGTNRRQGRTDASGRCTFDNLPGGFYYVKLVDQALTESFTLEPDGAQYVEFRIGGGSVAGRVSLAGKPVRARVWLANPAQPERAFHQTDTTPDGSFAITDVEPGSYALRLSRYGPYSDVGRQWPVNVSDGQRTRVEVVLPTGCISGVVRHPDGRPGAGISVIVTAADPQVSFAAERTTSNDGAFRFEDLEPGSYSVTAHSRDESAAAAGTAVVPEDGHTVLPLTLMPQSPSAPKRPATETGRRGGKQ